MLIPVNLSLPQPADSAASLPPQLVRLASNDVALIELQGNFLIDGDDPATGLGVGTLHLDASVRPPLPRRFPLSPTRQITG